MSGQDECPLGLSRETLCDSDVDQLCLYKSTVGYNYTASTMRAIHSVPIKSPLFNTKRVMENCVKLCHSFLN